MLSIKEKNLKSKNCLYTEYYLRPPGHFLTGKKTIEYTAAR